MKKIILASLFACISVASKAQNTYAEIGAAVGNNAMSYGAALHHNWAKGKKSKLIIGTGIRATSFSGENQKFLSAPAKLAADPASTAEVLLVKPSMTSVNAMINIGYRVSSKLEAGFNIDAVGVSFGPSSGYVSGNINTTVQPTSVNLLLVGNNDRGSLNSHFYAKYNFSKKIGVKVAYQFLFNEITSKVPIQTQPENNDRFRLKSSMIFGGLFYNF